MHKPILEFKGDNLWLSNFYVGKPFSVHGIKYTNGEAAFQAQKAYCAKELDNVLGVMLMQLRGQIGPAF